MLWFASNEWDVAIDGRQTRTLFTFGEGNLLKIKIFYDRELNADCRCCFITAEQFNYLSKYSCNNKNKNYYR